MTTGQSTVTTTAGLIAPANNQRACCILSSLADLYIGNSSVTVATGMYVKAGQPYPIETTAAIYGVTATGTAACTYLDQTYSNSYNVVL